MPRPSHVLPIALVGAALLASCAFTEITSEWRDEAYQATPGHVLVIGILEESLNRRILEDGFVRELRSRGLTAEPGYKALPDGTLESDTTRAKAVPTNTTPALDLPPLPDRSVVEDVLTRGGFDTLLLVKLVDKKTQREYVPGRVSGGPTHSQWHGAYRSGRDMAYMPPHVVERVLAITEASLYDASSEQPIWTAATETELESEEQKVIEDYVDIVVEALEKQGLVRTLG